MPLLAVKKPLSISFSSDIIGLSGPVGGRGRRTRLSQIATIFQTGSSIFMITNNNTSKNTNNKHYLIFTDFILHKLTPVNILYVYATF
jgi:uncharacterized protein Veg